MRVVITGGSGRLGQYVARELFTHNHAVAALDAIKPRECLCPTYTVDLMKIDSFVEHLNNADALVHLARVRFPYTENGYNVAEHKWEFADIAGDAERFNRNIAMTNNVLAAAQACAVKKVVCGSSLAVYGFYYSCTELQPAYLPVDEDHPLRPQDAYGMTKLIGEKLCDVFSQKTGAQVSSLRFAGIYTEAHRSMLLDRKKNPLARGTGALWSYIDARDAARACRLALEAEVGGHQTFNVCASSTIMDTPTRELVARYLPRVTDLRSGLDDRSSAYSIDKAKRLLRFEPRCSLVD